MKEILVTTDNQISGNVWVSPLINNHFSYVGEMLRVSVAEDSVVRVPLSGRICYYAQSVRFSQMETQKDLKASRIPFTSVTMHTFCLYIYIF